MTPTLSLFVFALTVFGLSFLLADARIFGCDTGHYTQLKEQGIENLAEKIGIINLRPSLLRIHFFHELFHCYFCLGVWCGPAAHVLLLNFFGSSYWMYHEQTLSGYGQALPICILVSGPLNYLVDAFIKRLE